MKAKALSSLRGGRALAQHNRVAAVLLCEMFIVCEIAILLRISCMKSLLRPVTEMKDKKLQDFEKQIG
jgi:hypothetical protein